MGDDSIYFKHKKKKKHKTKLFVSKIVSNYSIRIFLTAHIQCNLFIWIGKFLKIMEQNDLICVPHI